ncbi:MAG: T9SS type A sorting domain-containing protein [Ignavibacteriaceae bacterium]|nr:T9SS type A sorting domain-containing protein [Ignavibacteriaceae bacterium]
MKTKTNYFVVVLVVLFTSVSFAQISFIKHTIDGNFSGAASVYAIDVNGDSLIDVLGAGGGANSITMWKNDGNNPIFWEEQTVVYNFQVASSVFSVDLDNDGDNDVLGSAWMDDEIAWWSNNGGNPVEWTKQPIDQNFDGAQEIYATDIDGDEDIDVLGAAMNGNQIVLWYNNGETPITWSKQIIAENFDWARSVYALDVNDDTRIDILGAAYSVNKISLWINNGDSTWTEQVIDSNFPGAHKVYACDIDNDNDIDILGAAHLGDEVAWWENEEGNPIQWTKHTIEQNLDGAISVYACDIDKDGDADVLGGAEVANDVTLWLNNGDSPVTWTKQTIDCDFAGAWGVFAEDIDNDSTIDIIAAASIANDIAWWENDGIVGINDQPNFPSKIKLFQNYPNPFNPSTKIKYQIPKLSFVSLKVYDVLGNEIAILVNEEKPAGNYEVDFSATGGSASGGNVYNLPSGIYIYKLNAGKFTKTNKMILLK